MSSVPTFNTRNTVTGVLQRLTADQIKPFEKVLEIVADDAKPYEPGMFKPGEVGEFKNPELAPQSVEEAQAAYDAVLAEGGPRTKSALGAKAALDAAIEKAESAIVGDAGSGDSSTTEGDIQ